MFAKVNGKDVLLSLDTLGFLTNGKTWYGRLLQMQKECTKVLMAIKEYVDKSIFLISTLTKINYLKIKYSKS